MNRQSCLNALTAVIVYAAITFIAGCAAPVQPDHTPARYRHLAIEVSAARPGVDSLVGGLTERVRTVFQESRAFERVTLAGAGEPYDAKVSVTITHSKDYMWTLSRVWSVVRVTDARTGRLIGESEVEGHDVLYAAQKPLDNAAVKIYNFSVGALREAEKTYGRVPEPAYPKQPVQVREQPPVAPTPIPPQRIAGIDFGNYHALVIGNNRYQFVPRLETAESDARTTADVLRRLYGFEVTLLVDATRRDIVYSLDRLRAQLTADDNLLIYYAGHGYYDEEANRGYWLPVDARTDTTAEWISNADITDKLKALRAKHVLVVVDSCYSGTLTRDISVTLRTPDYFERLARKRSRTVLTSGGLEPVVDKGGAGHSVFAQAFLTALRENAGVMDATQLFSKVRRPVMLNALQTPQYSDIRLAGHEGGDFLFVRR